MCGVEGHSYPSLSLSSLPVLNLGKARGWNPYTEKGNDHRDQIEKMWRGALRRQTNTASRVHHFPSCARIGSLDLHSLHLYSPATRTLAQASLCRGAITVTHMIIASCLHVHNCKPKSNPGGCCVIHKCEKGKIKENCCFCGIVVKIDMRVGMN